MGGYAVIVPEMVVLATAIVVLFSDVLTRGRARAGAWIGAAGALAAAVVALKVGVGSVPVFGAMLRVDGLAVFARVATLGLTALYLVWLAGKGTGSAGGARTAAALVLFSALGCMLMVSARDFVVLILAMETATMPAYVLIGLDRTDERGLEGALKYFLLSMATSLVLFYGVSLLLALSGTTAFAGVSLMGGGVIAVLAVAFVTVGLLAKLSAAPFHYWAPDAYAGASPAAVAFVSAVPKIAGVVALARVTGIFAEQMPSVLPALAIVAAASMLLGNLAAIPQKDIRRMMAYSGVAHAGYLIMGLSLGTATGARSAVLYALMYALPSMGVMFVVADAGVTLDRMAGLVRRRPGLAWASVVMLASLIGVPPLAGFMGKFQLFSETLDAGAWGLVLLAVVTSAISAGYYFKIIRAAFLKEGSSAAEASKGRTRAADLAVWVCVAAVVAAGIAAGPLLASIGLAAP